MFGNARVRMPFVGALLAFALLCVSSPTLLQAQGTGRITGRVIDKKTNKPLGFANVIIVGTNKGAMSLDDGKFAVEGVPVGTYTVKAMMMGYKTVEVARIAVNANRATEVTFTLVETIVAETQVIEVTGERKMIDVTSSDVRSSVTDEQMLDMPVDSAIEAIALKTGIVKTGDELHARGGRSGEIQMQIDGVPVDDPLGGAAMDVGLLGVSGSDFIAGGMDAEYGNAQSGVINISTKEGGNVFGGEFRYMTDDFGRQDKTFTNFDRVSLGFGGPTPWKSVRYYVSAEGTFLDGENVSIEQRTEHKLTNWLKARDRMNHSLNVQTKLSWNHAPFKVTGEAIVQRSRRELYRHNWNLQGSVQKVYYFQRLIPTGTGQDVFSFGGISVQFEGPWLDAVNDPARQPNPRTVEVVQIVRDPDGIATERKFFNFRAIDVNGQTILWDEALVDAGGQPTGGSRSWILFEGFQFPFRDFRATPAGDASDSSFVFFNSASRTPEIENHNLQLQLSFNHNIADDILYSVNFSRLAFNRTQTVSGKAPGQFTSAGLPTQLPSGTFLQGGVSQRTWYTDPDFPYFVTAYDSPFFEDRQTVQYLVKGDLTSERVKGHRMKAGVQFIYNDLNQETRVFPAQTRENPSEGTSQQGRNVNLFHNFNPEGAVYAQDKWEYEGMVVNAGVRWEFFSTGNNDESLINNVEIPKEVQTFKQNVSPRLGIAFPITDRDKFFFHYGRFTQWPSRTFLFATQDAIGSIGTLGNPNLGPELTISYQAGISHQFSEDVAGNFVVFSKDIYGLISSTLVTDDSTGILSTRFINKTYASSRGLELSLEKRLSRRFGFEAYYTYSFADGVSSDSDFGRSAQGLTHLPTDERPLDWDQRHTFNVTLRMRERNNWGATAIYQFGSGLPWTPIDRFARLQDPLQENANRFESSHRVSIQGRKKFNIYGRDLTLFFEGRNLLDEDILLPGQDAPGVFPQMAVAQMDEGSYLTETGRFGGAYLQDIDDDGRDDFVPVTDPTVFEQHRIWRIGFGFEF